MRLAKDARYMPMQAKNKVYKSLVNKRFKINIFK